MLRGIPFFGAAGSVLKPAVKERSFGTGIAPFEILPHPGKYRADFTP